MCLFGSSSTMRAGRVAADADRQHVEVARRVERRPPAGGALHDLDGDGHGELLSRPYVAPAPAVLDPVPFIIAQNCSPGGRLSHSSSERPKSSEGSASHAESGSHSRSARSRRPPSCRRRAPARRTASAASRRGSAWSHRSPRAARSQRASKRRCDKRGVDRRGVGARRDRLERDRLDLVEPGAGRKQRGDRIQAGRRQRAGHGEREIAARPRRRSAPSARPRRCRRSRPGRARSATPAWKGMRRASCAPRRCLLPSIASCSQRSQAR